MASDGNGTRINIRSSDEIVGYLDDLAEIGIHGKTRTEVAKALIATQIERLIREGLLKLRNRDKS